MNWSWIPAYLVLVFVASLASTCEDSAIFCIARFGCCLVQDLNDEDALPHSTIQKMANMTQIYFQNVNLSRFYVDDLRHIFKGESIVFSRGTVLKIYFQSDSLQQLQVFNSQLELFHVMQVENRSLKNLTLTSRNYREISPSISRLQSLEVAKLRRSSLVEVNMSFFAAIPTLRELDLSNNKITHLWMPSKEKFASLIHLDISGNKLKHLNYFPEAFPALKTVSLVRNDWDCDWVGAARVSVLNAAVAVFGEELVCPPKFESNGGLCCTNVGSNDLDPTILRDETRKRLVTFTVTLSEDISSNGFYNTSQVSYLDSSK